MAKTSVADWDTTASNNTDINSISLAENVMRPPAVNNAFREMMAQIKAGVPYLSSTTIVFPTGATGLSLSSSGAGTMASFTSTDGGAAIGPVVDLYRNSASPSASDLLGGIEFNGKDSGAAKQLFARIAAAVSSATAGAELGTLTLSVVELGSLVAYIVADASTGVAINRPLDLSNASAGQIKFPATQVPSANANTLDDYEEFTFQLSGAFATVGTSSWAYTTRDGVGTKVGDTVAISGAFSATPTIGTGSSAFRVTGIPFSCAAGMNVPLALVELNNNFTWPSSRTMVQAYAPSLQSYVQFVGMGSAQNPSFLTASNMTTGALHNVNFGGTVKVS